MASEDLKFDWTPERIVVPHGQDAPFSWSSGVFQGISGYIDDGTIETREGSFATHIFVTSIEDEAGTDLDEAVVVLDQSELADATVFYVWRVAPMREALRGSGLPSMLWAITIESFVSGFAQSRAELLKTRFSDNYKIERDLHHLDASSRPDWYVRMSEPLP